MTLTASHSSVFCLFHGGGFSFFPRRGYRLEREWPLYFFLPTPSNLYVVSFLLIVLFNFKSPFVILCSLTYISLFVSTAVDTHLIHLLCMAIYSCIHLFPAPRAINGWLWKLDVWGGRLKIREEREAVNRRIRCLNEWLIPCEIMSLGKGFLFIFPVLTLFPLVILFCFTPRWGIEIWWRDFRKGIHFHYSNRTQYVPLIWIIRRFWFLSGLQ